MSSSTKDELLIVKEVLNRLDTSHFIIGVDGILGVGKSGLSKKLRSDFKKSEMGCEIIKIDDYLIKNNESLFKNYLRYENLKADIEANLKERNILIIDGVLLLFVLKKINISNDMIIYVEPMFDSPRRKVFENIRDVTSLLDGSIYDKQLIELQDYHREFNPESQAWCHFQHQGSWFDEI